jgi:NTE family protein
MTDGQTHEQDADDQCTEQQRVARDTGHAAEFPGQVVLVLQGGGALGAYQVGVYEAMHEHGASRLGDRDIDWRDQCRADRGQHAGQPICAAEGVLVRVEAEASTPDFLQFFTGLANASVNLSTVARGIPAFFTPHGPAWFGSHIPLGVESAAYYTTKPLRETLSGLIDLEHMRPGAFV